MLPGVHRVRKTRRNGNAVEFWYAWRGGPRILFAEATSELLLAREVERLSPAAVLAYEEHKRPKSDRRFLYGLVTRYLESPDFAGLADRTKKDRRKFLDMARADLGEMELRALESRRARALLIGWRDKFKATPKTADERLGALSIVLQWAADRGELASNPAREFPRIYRANRADVIWRPQDLATLFRHSAPELQHAVRLAALTGLRLGDLIRLPWSAVGLNAIVWQTGKSRGRRTVVIPITPELRKLLAEIPQGDCVTVLNSSRQRPWTAPGLESALRRAKLDAAAHAVKTGGPGATSGLEALRFHDLRGTAATTFIQRGLTLDEVATILGWEKRRVEEIAARYVTAEAIGLAMVKRLSGTPGKRQL